MTQIMVFIILRFMIKYLEIMCEGRDILTGKQVLMISLRTFTHFKKKQNR